MARQGWIATGVIEASVDRVVDVLLSVEEGSIGDGNAPLLRTVPGAGPSMAVRSRSPSTMDRMLVAHRRGGS